MKTKNKNKMFEMYKDKKKLAHIKISKINWDEPIVEELKERATLQDFEFDQEFSEFEQTEEYKDFLDSYYYAQTRGNGGYYVIFFDGKDFTTSIFSSNTHIYPKYQEQIVWSDNWFGDTGIEYWIDEWDKTGETDEEGTPEWENEEGETIFVSEDSGIWGDKDNINIVPENPNLPNEELLDFLMDKSYITIYEDGSYCIYAPDMDAVNEVHGSYTCDTFTTHSCGGEGEYEWDEEEFKKLGAEIEYDKS